MTRRAYRVASRRDLWLVCSVAALAALVRLIDVNGPSRNVFDEFWYARDGCFYWRASAEACGLADLVASDRDVTTWLASYRELTPEHPPLAKWLIGAPMWLLPYAPGVWRLAPVTAGVVTVALLYLLTERALASRTAATGASVLLAIDYAHFVHSRLAMLEVFVTLFVLAAFYFCLLDHEQVRARAEGRPSHARWRAAAGVAAGCAAACKISGFAAVAGVVVLITAWEVGARRRSPGARSPGRTTARIALFLVLVPLLVYVATYVGRLQGSLLAVPWGEGAWLREWAERQSYIFHFHADKPPASERPLLPMLEDPTPFVLERTNGGVREILLFGNPLLWWGGFAAVACAGVWWARRPRAVVEPLIVVGALAGYGAWSLAVLSNGPVHLFYAVPVAPFLYLALAFVYARVAGARVARLAAGAVVIAAALGFAFYLPILSARALDHSNWRLRACSAQVLWLDPEDGCGLRSGGITRSSELRPSELREETADEDRAATVARDAPRLRRRALTAG